MSRVRFVPPPPPPDGRQWCLMCLMLAKAKTVDAHPDLADVHQDGKKADHWVPWDDTILLEPAEFRGPCDFAQLGLIDVCWTHLAAIRIARASPLALPNPPPPGFLGRN